MTSREKVDQYPIVIHRLAPEEGGGFHAFYPRLKRSVSGYGETRQEALSELLEAADVLLESLERDEVELPDPPRNPEELHGLSTPWGTLRAELTVPSPRSVVFSVWLGAWPVVSVQYDPQEPRLVTLAARGPDSQDPPQTFPFALPQQAGREEKP